MADQIATGANGNHSVTLNIKEDHDLNHKDSSSSCSFLTVPFIQKVTPYLLILATSSNEPCNFCLNFVFVL